MKRQLDTNYTTSRLIFLYKDCVATVWRHYSNTFMNCCAYIYTISIGYEDIIVIFDIFVISKIPMFSHQIRHACFTTYK